MLTPGTFIQQNDPRAFYIYRSYGSENLNTAMSHLLLVSLDLGAISGIPLILRLDIPLSQAIFPRRCALNLTIARRDSRSAYGLVYQLLGLSVLDCQRMNQGEIVVRNEGFELEGPSTFMDCV